MPLTRLTRIAYLAVMTTIALVLTSCGADPSIPSANEAGLATAIETDSQSGHVRWGDWDVFLFPETCEAIVAPARRMEFHVNVTSFLQPPNCSDCLQVLITHWDPITRIVDVTLVLKNPTALTGYDVKAIISDYDTKSFLDPDAYADFYTDGTTWDPYYVFADDVEDNAFGDGESHARGIQLYFPYGSTPYAMITVDASWPVPQPEPWRIDNIVVAGPLQNDSYHHISFTCHVRDHQDDVDVMFADLTPVGPSNVAMGDDSLHKDYLAGDGIWGLDEIKTSTLPGVYSIWVKAQSLASPHFTYQKIVLEVIAPVPDHPPLYVVSMMHAEEQDFYLNEATFTGYADTLRDLMQVFDNHGAKIALQPDWTFIQGEQDFDPTLFAEFQASGHGVDTHAHETQYDLGAVHDMLDNAGVQDTVIANGGFNQTWGDEGNWVAYIAHFTIPGGEQMFYAVNAYKDPLSQVVDSLYTPIRPSTTGDWMVHDPDGPLVYIPGAPEIGLTGADPNFFTVLPNAVDYALAGVIPDRVNCFYWHDPVSLYSGSPLSLTRLSFWDQLLDDYFDEKVTDGDIVWANFTEMYSAYIEWEE